MSCKQCFKCNVVKPLTEFYKHPMMKDGRLGKCKECNKKDVRANRKVKVDYYRKYDIERGNRQTREYRLKHAADYPLMYKAQNMVSNAIRDKRLFREPCETCGVTKTHAHHDDYSKPLNVRWLCIPHHSQWHKKHEAKNRN